MGAEVLDVQTAVDPTAETLLSSLKSIADSERRRHASIYSYWLSVRGKRQFPTIRDLDPLEISDAGRQSILLEVVGGGEDADVRHVGSGIGAGAEVEKLSDAPNPSVLSCILNNLPIVVASKDAYAFEDSFQGADGTTRCWVTLLPFSATGTWIDYVYGFVSLDPSPEAEAEAEEPEPAAEPVEVAPEPEQAEDSPDAALDAEPEPEQAAQPSRHDDQSEAAADVTEAAVGGRAGFSTRFFDSLASVGGFYGRVAEVETGPWTVETVEPGEPAQAPSDAPEHPISTLEGPLQTKLDEVRAKADEARLAKLRSEAALIEGLSAAYDFALDAEQNAEEYLKLVEAQGLKIQLRSPMAPVVKLGFDGTCDDSTISRLEAVLAWALKQDLPRGSLSERIESEGGIDAIASGLNGKG